MTDEPTGTTQDVATETPPAPATPDVEIASAETPEPTDKHARTEQRLRRERNAAREQLTALQAQLESLKSEKETRMAEETQAQLTELQTQLEAARTELRQERLKASLTGKVVDVDAALKLLGTEHLAEDGTPKVDAFLERYPFLAASPAAAPTAPGGGGGSQGTGGKKYTQADLDRMTPAEINANWDAIQKDLNS
ncbi:hypothetical protein [Deinococcus peraridilitoris]|uniref:Scaffolding protein n=1 Tax=Deinococcus peraridilitoris (strain DSM 19664 / LMG 22246 / CIP 109416 / KR-200) TaxID=937777 RepID=L0A3I3_DEIPD|nr:hypothetical protein [Deinococcus peraridilitoris]AFZ67565.1 hypothetical protein Deipe_2069 [Deinococcus peraridilitoris DSM 19664]